MARDGIADLTLINPGYQPGRFPVIGAGELPFLLADAKGGSQAIDAWYRKYAAAEMKDVKFCLAFVHDPGSFHSRTRKIVVPDDIKGMKIRPAAATIANFVTMLGDMEYPLYTTTLAFVFNKATYGAMSAAQKKVIDDHCSNEWALTIAAPWADFEHGGIAKIKAEAGHEVYAPTPDQVAAWRKAAEPLAKQWADGVRKVGGNPDGMMTELHAQIDKFGAAAH
jgi:TRAP-type C4-dicarboxylate transport system substrate-binding protein